MTRLTLTCLCSARIGERLWTWPGVRGQIIGCLLSYGTGTEALEMTSLAGLPETLNAKKAFLKTRRIFFLSRYSYSVPVIFSEPSQCAGGPDKRGTWGDPRPVEADRGRAGGDETFETSVITSWEWELFGIFLANQTIRLQCTLRAICTSSLPSQPPGARAVQKQKRRLSRNM